MQEQKQSVKKKNWGFYKEHKQKFKTCMENQTGERKKKEAKREEKCESILR